jgi:capsular exopolysaccharide synthesis family protein
MQTQNSLSQLLYPLKKRWYLILFSVAIMSVLATRYLYLTTPVYQATSTIKIEDAQQGASSSNLYRDFDVFKTNTKVQTEVEVLKSRNFFMKALNSLDYYVEYYQDDLRNQEVYQASPFIVNFNISDSSFYNREFQFQYVKGDQYKVSYEYKGVQFQKVGTFGKQLRADDIELNIIKNEKIIKYKSSNYLEGNWSFIVYSPEALTNKMLTKDYLVKAVDKDVNVIKIYYSYPVAVKAQRLVNAIAETYIKESIEDKKDIAGNTVDFINQQLRVVSVELEQARDAVKQYRVENEIVNIPQATEATYRTLGELEVQKVDINMQLSSLENMSEYLRRDKQINFSGPSYGEVSDGLFSEAVMQLNSKIREREQVLQKYTTESDEVKLIDKEIAQRKSYLVESINNTRRKLLGRQDELFVEIEEQKSSFDGVPEKESTLQELTRNYYLFEKVYSFLIEKRTEAIITRQVNVSFNKVLEAAPLPIEALSPHKNIVWAIAMLFGLILGIVLAYVRHFIRPSINTPNDIIPNSSIPVIGQVEKLKQNDSIFQSFSNLSTRILMNLENDKCSVITVTSTRGGEGKSFIAANLARTLASMDKKIILVDLNTYNPIIDEWFDVRKENGIRQVFSRQSTLQDSIQITSIPKLDVISAGEDEGHFSHLLATSKTKEIIDELKLQYDCVIIDTPEVGVYTDAIPFMRWSDLNLYVVKADGEREELIMNAEMVKEEYKLKEVHFVLNAMTAKRNHTGLLPPQRTIKRTRKNVRKQITSLFAW